MSANRIDGILTKKAADTTADAPLPGLTVKTNANGAESRAAEIATQRVVRGRYRYAGGLGWLYYGAGRWVGGPNAEERVCQEVRWFVDRTEREYRAQAAQAESDAKAITKAAMEKYVAEQEALPEDERDTKKLDVMEVLLKYTDEATMAVYTQKCQEADYATCQAAIWLNLLSRSKVEALVKFAAGTDGVLTDHTEFDAHHDLLNFENCTVDLRTGEQLTHNPDHLITKQAACAYDPAAQSADWDKAMEAVHPDVMEWFQLRMGQTFTGYTPDDDALVLASGGGENGKSLIMGAINHACGDYGDTISHRVLIAQPGQHPTELMDLRGLRFALLEETPEEGRLDTHQLKTTVGTPQITARRMRQDPVTFNTTHSMWINTNHLPIVDTTDHGTWRRLKSMPWPFKFRKESEACTEPNDRPGDRTLKPRVLGGNPQVPPAVMRWIVEGARKWYAAERLTPVDPPLVEEATREWRANSDVGYQFALERLVEARDADGRPTHFIKGPDMRKAMNDFLTEQGKREWSSQTINSRLPESLAQADITIKATPGKVSKLRAGMVASTTELWGAVGGPLPKETTGKVWVGVRFRTAQDAERQYAESRNLRVVGQQAPADAMTPEEMQAMFDSM